jgi:hypothetical protein
MYMSRSYKRMLEDFAFAQGFVNGSKKQLEAFSHIVPAVCRKQIEASLLYLNIFESSLFYVEDVLTQKQRQQEKKKGNKKRKSKSKKIKGV